MKKNNTCYKAIKSCSHECSESFAIYLKQTCFPKKKKKKSKPLNLQHKLITPSRFFQNKRSHCAFTVTREMQPKYSAVIPIQDLKRFTNVQYSREGSTLCLHRVKHMEMFQVIAASQGTNTGVEQHHTRFCREKKSDLLGPFQTQNTGTCLERAQTNAGFSQNSSKMLSRTKSTIVAAKSPFTLAPTSVWVSLAALGPAQPQRLLIPPQPPPSGVCCPHQPAPTCSKANPSLLGWERAPR